MVSVQPTYNTLEHPDTMSLADPNVERVEVSGRMAYRVSPNFLRVLAFLRDGSRRDQAELDKDFTVSADVIRISFLRNAVSSVTR